MTWHVRWAVVLLLMLAVPALAQTNSGPVRYPASPITSTTNTAPAALTIPSVAPSITAPSSTTISDAGGDIRDIRGPILIPYAWLWLAVVVGVLAVAAALFGLWRWLRTRRKEAAKTPYQLARERLEEARGLLSPGTAREYAFAVSEVVRVYIEQQFGEKAARRTTEEFLSDLLRQTGTPLARHSQLLRDFLGHCELPKYARYQLSVADMEAMHASARSFLDDTGTAGVRDEMTGSGPVLPPLPSTVSTR